MTGPGLRAGGGNAHRGSGERSTRLWLIAAAAALAAGAVAAWQEVGAPPVATTPPPAASTAAGPKAGEAYRWRTVAIGGGGFIVDLSSDARGQTLVARTDVHGAYVWQPDLDRWAQLATAPAMPPAWRRPASMEGGVFAIAVAPSDSRRLYMAAHGTVFRSADRGAHWLTPEAGPLPVKTFAAGPDYLRDDPVIAVSPADPDLVLLGTGYDGLLRSADGGVRWTAATGLPLPHPAASGALRPVTAWFVPGAPGASPVWAFVPGAGMFASRDGGRSFAPLVPAGRPSPLAMSAGAFAADGGFFGADPERGTVWRWHDGGWTDLVAAGLLPAGRYQTLAIDPRSGAVWAFEISGRAHRSEDGGAGWTTLPVRSRVGEGDPPWLHVANQHFFATSQVRFDPAVPHRLWIAAGTGVFRADVPPGTASITWVSQTRGIEELVTNDVVQPHGHAPLFANWDFGIHVKSDLDAFSTTYGPRERVLIAAQALAVTPADPGFVVTNASDTRSCCSEDGRSVLAGTSDDAGATWTRFATLPQPPGTRADDPWRMAFGDIAVSSGDPDDIVWLPSFNRAPFVTRDRGRSWTRIAFPGERLPFTGSHAAKHLPRKVLAADPVRKGVFYLVHSGNPANPQLQGLWRSEDGGLTWAMRFRGEIAPSSGQAAKLRAMPGRAGDLFFTSAVTGAPDTRLRRSRDGGATWAVVPGVTEVDDVAFGKAAARSRAAAIYLSGRVDGDYGIWRSVDDGGSWARIAELPLGRLDRVVVLGADPDVFGRVYIGWQGSGWLYGEPAPCRPAPLAPLAREECFAVDPGRRTR